MRKGSPGPRVARFTFVSHIGRAKLTRRCRKSDDLQSINRADPVASTMVGPIFLFGEAAGYVHVGLVNNLSGIQKIV